MPRKNVVIGGRAIALDARPDRVDLRDLPYRPPLGGLPRRWPEDRVATDMLRDYTEAGLVLDQGSDGACTGFGLAAVISYQLFVRDRGSVGAARRVSPAMLYQLARIYDEWPGEDYEGSSCRGALKGWHRHGVCREGLWPYVIRRGRRVFVPPSEDPAHADDPTRNWDVDALHCTLGVYYRVDARSVVDMQAAIHDTGGIYVAATAHEGWAVPTRRRLRGHDDLVRVTHVAKPRDAGGHAFALVGYNELGFVVQNSWGTDWGSRGFALLPYEEWVRHGDDAWVFTLGVPRHEAAVARRTGGERILRSPRFVGTRPDEKDSAAHARPIGLIGADDVLSRRYRDVPTRFQPLDVDHAYRHTVLLDRGLAVRNDVTAPHAAAAVYETVCTRPSAWMSARGTRKVLLYVHGGLNSESTSLARIRVLAPYALEHGIYPIFLSWRTGVLETVGDLVEEAFAKLGFGRGEPARGWDRLTDKTDRMLEVVLRAPGSALWSQMKRNAERASEASEGGARLVAAGLKDLAGAHPTLEIHLAGHSAGAILIGAMFERLRDHRLSAASTRLFAPACTTRFALARFRPAVRSGVLDPRHWFIHTLSDRNERADTVSLYRKSLLYLVSRSFEDTHKTPLLGLDATFDPTTVVGRKDDLWASDLARDVEQWLEFWNGLGLGNDHRIVLERPSVSTGGGTTTSTHGSYDNAVDALGDMLGYVADPGNPTRIRIHRLDY